MFINKENEGNQKLVKYLKGNRNIQYYSIDPSNINKDNWSLSVDPQLVDVLWIDFAKELPENCQWILCDLPVLINPKSGIVFGVAEGNLPPLLRFSNDTLEMVLKLGAKRQLENLDGIYADANELGTNWVFCFSFFENIAQLCYQSYVEAGRQVL